MRGSVLFVDDDVMTQWIMSEVLTEAGFEVTSVSRRTEALRLLEQGDGFDVLLTDFDLPDELSGIDLATHWHLLNPGRPVIYTSTHSMSLAGQLEQNEAFFQKSSDAGTLLRVMDGLLDETLPGGGPRQSTVRRMEQLH